MPRLRLAVALIVLMSATPGAAHTKLSESVPAADAELTTAPAAVELQFSQDVRLTLLRMTRGDTPVPVGDAPAQTGASFSVAILAPMPAGRYRVEWRAVSADTHVVSGEFSFDVTAD